MMQRWVMQPRLRRRELGAGKKWVKSQENAGDLNYLLKDLKKMLEKNWTGKGARAGKAEGGKCWLNSLRAKKSQPKYVLLVFGGPILS